MKTRAWIAALTLSAPLLGCASLGNGNGKAKDLSAEEAARTFVIGRSSMADVRAALGNAHVNRFDNGYELWLYEVGVPKFVDSLPWVNLVLSSTDNAREITVLFDRNGIVKKYQVRDK